MDTITIPKGARNRWYYVIVMPLDEHGRGPVSEELGEVRKLTWEVWDQQYLSVASFDYLPDALDKADELNEEWYKEEVLGKTVRPED